MLLVLVFFVAHSNLKILNRYHPMYSKKEWFFVSKKSGIYHSLTTKNVVEFDLLSTNHKKNIYFKSICHWAILLFLDVNKIIKIQRPIVVLINEVNFFCRRYYFKFFQNSLNPAFRAKISPKPAKQ